jgi:hypothetical protein
MDLTKQDPEAMRKWLNVDGVGVNSTSAAQTRMGKQREFTIEIVAFLAMDEKRVKRARLGEPIEYMPRTKEEKA